MKAKYAGYAGILALMSVGSIEQAGAGGLLTNGLIAYYSFEGNAHDSSGNGNDGALKGDIYFKEDRFGKANSAIDFTGAGKVTTSFYPPLGTGSRTLAGWFNVPFQSSQMTLLSYGDPGSGARIELKISGVNSAGCTAVGQFALDTSQGTVWTTATYNDKTWHEFAVTIPPNAVLSDVVIYIDGVQQTTATDSPSHAIDTIGTYPLQFGEVTPIVWDSRQLAGALDDVAIYNRALTKSEVRQLHEIESENSETPPVIISQAQHLKLNNHTAASFNEVVASPEPVVNRGGVFLGLYPGLTITGAVGQTFGIQYTTDLSQSNGWTTITNVTLSQPTMMWFDSSDNISDGTQPRRFYRTVKLPQM